MMGGRNIIGRPISAAKKRAPWLSKSKVSKNVLEEL